jgi:hypothetical protein
MYTGSLSLLRVSESTSMDMYRYAMLMRRACLFTNDMCFIGRQILRRE